jgi:hypothetical protein
LAAHFYNKKNDKKEDDMIESKLSENKPAEDPNFWLKWFVLGFFFVMFIDYI